MKQTDQSLWPTPHEALFLSWHHLYALLLFPQRGLLKEVIPSPFFLPPPTPAGETQDCTQGAILPLGESWVEGTRI